MKVLVLNCGSSSVKYKLFNMQEKNVLARGMVDRIGLTSSSLRHKNLRREELVSEQNIPDHEEAVKSILQVLTHKEYGSLRSVHDIEAVGHRVVHGGESFQSPVAVDDNVIKILEECSELAPLHNPPNVAGIKICRNLMSDTPQVAVFDTAFHQTMPDYAYIYALPYEYYIKYRLRKYGFHGTSHQYVSKRAAKIVGKELEALRIITCHLGNGASLCAIKGGKSMDTTMGFTPLAGLVMGTRCGNIDPAIVSFLAEKEHHELPEVSRILNKESGVLGISGLSSDFRDLEKAAGEGHDRARLALDVFVYSVTREIGALIAALGGLDMLVFTAGIGENSPEIRRRVCAGLAYMGIDLDENKNAARGEEVIISSDQSKIEVAVIPTDEELMIAEETHRMVQ